MRIRTATATALGAALALVLAGCTTPAPVTPTPTPAFSSEEEAFAAAEETYRAYVDALNQVDLSDPATFEAVYELTTGEANAGARKTFTQMHANQWTVAGPTLVSALESAETVSQEGINLDVCLDVSGVTLVDAAGESVVAPDRRDIQSMRVTLEHSATTSTGLSISVIDGREDGLECAS